MNIEDVQILQNQILCMELEIENLKMENANLTADAKAYKALVRNGFMAYDLFHDVERKVMCEVEPEDRSVGIFGETVSWFIQSSED